MERQRTVIATGYRRFAYYFFRWVDSKPREGIVELLYKADIQMLPGMFVGTIVFTCVIATVASFVGSYIFFTRFYQTSLWLVLTLSVTGAAGVMSVAAYPIMTTNKIGSKRVKIDSAMPFVLAYMATLSSAGMNPVEVLRHVALKDFGPISNEYRKIVYRFDVLGEDVISAINYIAKNTPSQAFHDILMGISNIIVSGGSLKSYCEQESKNLFEERKSAMRRFIDSLAAYSEGYVGGVVVTVIMGVVGIIIIGSLGIKIEPYLTTQDVMLIFTFFMVPFVNIIYLGMLELKFSGDTV